MTRRHVPLSQRQAGRTATSGPFQGVPQWLRYSLWVWVDWVFKAESSFNSGLLGRLERELRLPLKGSFDWERYEQLEAAVSDPERFLDVVNFLLDTFKNDWSDDIEKAAYLDEALAQAGSVWGVAKSHESYRLVERVDPSVAAAIAEATEPTDRASQHLSTALAEAYGRDPNASHAYREAVRAVEAIAKPTVTPKDDNATLGKMINSFRDKPEKWSAVLSPGKGDPVLQIAHTMELLWMAQLDRHGTDDDSKPLNVSIEEARAAVHIAAALVQLFRSNAISLR